MILILPVLLWILIMAMMWEKIKSDRKSMKEFEAWRKSCHEYLKEKNT